jgi:hypothetical protein
MTYQDIKKLHNLKFPCSTCLPYKPDEFVNSMRSFLPKICKQKGCLDFIFHVEDFVFPVECKTGRFRSNFKLSP